MNRIRIAIVLVTSALIGVTSLAHAAGVSHATGTTVLNSSGTSNSNTNGNSNWNFTFNSDSDDLWQVGVHFERSRGNGNLNASWTMPSNQDGAAIFCFDDGGQGVSVCGIEPCKMENAEWPCWSGNDRDQDPDLAVILKLSVTPQDNDMIKINGHLERMTRVGARGKRQFAMASESFTRIEEIGSVWDLKVGETEDGEQFTLNIQIDGNAPSSVQRTSATRELVHVNIIHELDDLRTRGNSPDDFQSGGLEIGPSNEDKTSVRLETALTPYKGDSTVLFTEISFKDIRIREDANGRKRMRVTFVMDRSLAIGVQPSADPGMTTIDGTMVMSSFERNITLRPGKPLRIRIPRQSGERKYIETDEVLELRME